MKEKQILKKLRNDKDYYGDFGNQFLSNSHIGKLLKDPLNAFEPSKRTPAFAIGGYFHTCILEPDKLDKYKVVKSTTRNTKQYKDVAGGELCLLQQEVDMIELMRDKVMENDICADLIMGTDGKLNDFEAPMITELFGNKSNVVEKIKKAAKVAITEKQMIKAKEFILAGGSIDAIKSKYKLTATQEKQLNEKTADITKA